MLVKLDAIIFGATGFTGQIVVQDAVEILKDFKWGIAGRNLAKLEDVLKKIGTKLGKDMSHIPIILADVDDKKSIEDMANKCKVLINCCGPYRFYGEVVVKACVEAGTHHVDVSGEPQYVDKMQLKYDALAREKKTYVISTCGFDSIPAEMGVIYAEDKFPGIINSVEMYWENFIEYKDPNSKALLHYGTWESIIYTMTHVRELLSLKRQLKPRHFPNLQPKLKMRHGIHKTNFSTAYFLPIHGADRDIVIHTQRLRYEHEHKRPIQFENYIGFRSIFLVLVVPILTLLVTILAQLKCSRTYLLKHPKLFTLGRISHQGPSEANMTALQFNMTFKANGWAKDQCMEEKPLLQQLTRVSGSNPFYGFTSVALLAVAKTILKESDKMPSSGGVLSPGAAFAHTSLIAELSQHKMGLKFEVLQA